MRKGFFIKQEDVFTKVTDHVGQFVPDQSLSLRDMLLQFAYISGEKVEEIVNRGFDGDEDDDVLGVDVGALDYAEIHDRALYLESALSRSSTAVQEPAQAPAQAPAQEPAKESEEPMDADA